MKEVVAKFKISRLSDVFRGGAPRAREGSGRMKTFWSMLKSDRFLGVTYILIAGLLILKESALYDAWLVGGVYFLLMDRIEELETNLVLALALTDQERLEIRNEIFVRKVDP